LLDPVIKVKDISKKFDNLIAVDKVSFEVSRREIYGLLGPNGAGKTTLFRIIAGIINPTEGEVEIYGVNPFSEESREVIGYCPQEPVAYDELTGVENLTFYAGLYGLDGREAKERSLKLLELVGLSEYAKKKVKTYSGGMKKRLNFAIALVGDPKVLLLDEPTTGMDPEIRRFIWSLIHKFKNEDKTILLATHYMEEAEELCDRVAIMDRGKIIAEGSPEELKRKSGLKSVINIELLEPKSEAIELVKPYALEKGAILDKNVLKVYVDDPDTSAPKVISRLLSHGYKLLSMKISPPTLEDVFLKLTGRRLREE